jgi:prevent-host-death family protein
MEKVGVRELKNSLSAYLRRVARGEHIVVTMRGKPVAELWPVGRGPQIDADLLSLEAEGRIALSRLPKPREAPPLAKGNASRHILQEREEDR